MILPPQGFIVVRGLLPAGWLEELRSCIFDLVTARLQSLGRDACDDLDDRLGQLLEINQQHAMDVIRAFKNTPEFYGAFTEPALLTVVRGLLGVKELHCVHDLAQIRIDPPNFHARDFPWHQDFQYNVASQNAVTAWFPLTPITKEMGYLAVIPGSHGTIIPVTEHREGHMPGRGTTHSTLRLDIDQVALEAQAVELTDIEPGDVVFFHCKLLHRSGKNHSTRCRLVMNPRYAEALDGDVVKRGWVTVSDRKPDAFREFFPKLIR